MIDRSPILPVLYLCGLSGLFLTLSELMGLSDGYIIGGLVMLTVVNLVFWFLYTRYTRMFMIVAGSATGLAALLLIPQVYAVSLQVKQLINQSRSINDLTLDPFFVIMLVFLAAFLLFALEFVMRIHSILFSIGLAVLIVLPIYGVRLSLVSVLLLAAFEAGFVVINMTERRSGRNVMTVSRRSRINLISMLITLGLTGLTLIPAFILEARGEGTLFGWAYQADGFLRENLHRMTGKQSENSVNNGNINRGNLYQTGKEQVKIYLNRLPSDTMYLRGYTGRDYSDGNWSFAFDPTGSVPLSSSYYDYHEANMKEPFINGLLYDFYQSYNRNSDNPETPLSFYYLISTGSDPISEMHYMLAPSTWFNENYFIPQASSGSPSYLQINPEEEKRGFLLNSTAGDIYITNLQSTDSTLYTPYFSQDSPARLLATPGSFSNQYSHNRYLTVDQINSSYQPKESDTVQSKNDDFYHALNQAYQTQISTAYTGYPDDVLARLKDYCSSTPLKELDEITTYILVTLDNHAVYTTTPGTTPYNKDVIDYFLFEGGKGYCVHYASAAALMYRMYGIPARYVSGFAAQPSDFKPSTELDGYYTCTLTDYSAHAWVEIYLENYGWVPVEVTPSSSGMMSASYPGYNMGVMRSIMSKYGWHFRSDSASADGTASYASDSVITQPDAGFVITMCIVLIVVPVALCTVLYIRRRHTLRSLSAMSCRRLFDRMIKMLHFSGLLKDCCGSEEDFAKRVHQVLPDIAPEQTQRVIDILLAVNYSGDKVPKADRDFIADYTARLSELLYQRTFFLKKPVFKWIRAFK